MEEELEHRIGVIRPQALEMVKEARAHGDLSENFEYKAAKQYKNENERRIRYLQNMIKTAIVIKEDSRQDQIGLNNTVRISFEEEAEEEVYKIVTTVRSNSIKGLISIDSPLGKALLGRKKGDRIYVSISEDVGYYARIIDFENTQDTGEDKLRSF